MALGLAVLALSVSAFGTMLFYVHAANIEATDMAEALAGKLAQEDMLAASVRLADRTKAQRAALDVLPLRSGEGVVFLSDLETYASRAGVSMSVSAVSAQPPEGNVPGFLSLSLQFAGTWSGCMNFVQLVETAPRAISVSALSLGRTGDSWSGSLSLRTVSFDEP